MSFVTTWIAVAGLASISIPIIIHLLFRRKRQPVEWGAMRLLMEALKRHRRRSRIEQILLLTIRCLILVLAALAIAEPLLSAFHSITGGSRLVVLLIDDGISSGVTGESGAPDLDRALESARSITDELNPGDRVALITMSHPPSLKTDGPTINIEGVGRLLAEIEPAPSRTNIEDSIGLARSIVDQHSSGSPTSVVMLGSWRRGSLSTAPDAAAPVPIESSSDRPLQFIASDPTDESVTILAVSDVSMRKTIESSKTDQPQIRTTVTVRRMGGSLDEKRSVVQLDGPGFEETLPRQIDWYPGRTDATIEFLSRASPIDAAADGSSIVTASLDDTTLPEATRRSMLVDTSGSIQVRIIDRRLFSSTGSLDEIEASDWMARALEPGEGGVVDVDWIDPSSLSEPSLRGVDAVILSRPDLIGERGWDSIEGFADSGGLVLVTPPSELDSHVWLDRMAEALDIAWEVGVEAITPDESTALGGEQPGGSILSRLDNELDQLAEPIEVFKRLDVDVSGGDGRVLLRCEDGSPLLIGWDPEGDRSGTIVLLTSSPHLDWTNLPIKPLMVPLMQELVREGVSTSRNSSQLLAGDVPGGSFSGVREITGPGGSTVSIDSERSFTTPLTRTGHWVARDAKGSALTTIVVNPDVEAADPEVTDVQDVVERFGVESGLEIIPDDQLAARFTSQESNPVWSLLLLVAALLLLIAETFLNRFFSRSVSRESPFVDSMEAVS